MTRRISHFRLLAVALAAATLAGTSVLHAYALFDIAWPSAPIHLRLQLDATRPSSPGFPLLDGRSSWDAVATEAVNDWNNSGTLVRARFTTSVSASRSSEFYDGVNSVVFSDTVYGEAFGPYTLAITLVDNSDELNMPNIRASEADLVVNNKEVWDSYRGPLRRPTIDLRRVILHELGHVLGLDHPDEATPRQNVAAIMNSMIEDNDTLQSDDRAGATYLYGTALSAPRITQQPTNVSATVSTPASITFGLNDGAPAQVPSLLSIQWFYRPSAGGDFEPLFTVRTPTLEFGSVQALDAGSYYVQVMTPDHVVKSNTVTLSTTPVTPSAATALVNLSTRGVVPAANDTTTSPMIVGFNVTGPRSKQVLIRAVGPTLGTFGVPGTLPDPVLKLYSQTNTTTPVRVSLTRWDQDSTTAAILEETMRRVGAFPLPPGSRDAVILTTLAPGGYSAVTSSDSGATGVVLVEAYDADMTRDPASRLANLSTRGYIGTGGAVLIAGFRVEGPGPRTYLIRIAGHTLGTYGVPATITDPILTLFGEQSTTLRVNDDWDSPSAAQPTLNAAFAQAGAFQFKYPSTVFDERDDSAMQPAMLVTLQSGSYTAQATGNENDGHTSPTGNALIEIYEMP